MTQRLDVYVERHTTLVRFLVVLRQSVLVVPLRGVELMLSSCAAITGFWMGWPWNNLYKSDSAYYQILVGYMPPWLWTLAFLFAAFPAAFLGGNVRWQQHCRVIGNSLLLSIWVLAACLFLADNAPYLATAWTPVFAFYQAWVLLALWMRLSEPLAKNAKP